MLKIQKVPSRRRILDYYFLFSKVGRYAKDKHTTFIFSVIQSGILSPFISDAKDKHLTFIFSVIRSQMFPPFISDAKHKHLTFILASCRAECYRDSFRTVKANTQHLF